jgi:hypothetical protein
MPIKFRCEHCRQFLGISHSKAGKLVDCPTCGRTIRVPDEEGNVLPLPDLKLNLQDAKLSSALDELALLGKAEVPAFEPESAVAVAESDDHEDAPQATQPGIVIAPPPPVVAAPIRLDPLLPAKPIPIPAHDPRQPAPVATMQELAALANLPTRMDPAAEQPIVATEPTFAARSRSPSTTNWFGIGWVIAGTLLGFVGGFVVRGRDDGSSPSVPNVPANAGAKPTPADNANVASGSTKDKSASVRGSITFLTEAGEQRPDKGARVLVLPETRGGTIKLSVVGLRPSDSAEDAAVASASLRALGGDVAVVDDSGNFELGSLAPGNYRILALSRYQPRDDRVAIDAELKGILESYFEKAEPLLGKCQFRLDKIKVTGQQPALWNHSFVRD